MSELNGVKRDACRHTTHAMTIGPLVNAAPAIQLHAFVAMAAFGLGLVQLVAPKGTIPHRTIGWIWVLLMLTVSVSSF